MPVIDCSDARPGNKVEVDKEPFIIVSNEFVKPGKGQPFNRIRLKHLLSGRVVERTFKSSDKLDEADVQEQKMRLLYSDGDGANFMQDESFEQVMVSKDALGDAAAWLQDDSTYVIIFYRGTAVNVQAPMFMDARLVETTPAIRGDTSGRVLKAAITDTGARVQVPIFVEEGELCRFDTRDGSYVSRVN
ncbi:MAG: elongation factor P [Chlamydiia bacterium]